MKFNVHTVNKSAAVKKNKIKKLSFRNRLITIFIYNIYLVGGNTRSGRRTHVIRVSKANTHWLVNQL